MPETPPPTVNLYVKRDLKSFEENADKFPIIFVEPIQDNQLHLEASISGPAGTPYEGGVFLLRLLLSEQHPFAPLISLKSQRPIMHPNVDEIGRFQSNLFHASCWSPTMGIQQILEHVWARLAVPDIESDYCDPTRAQEYRTDKEKFETVAREYTQKYA